jgi:hypothetical protein
MKDTVATYTTTNELDKVLLEATANENWNLSNTKLTLLADRCHN